MMALVTPPRPLRLVRQDDEAAVREQDEHQLLEGIASGDGAQATALYDRLRGPIGRAVRRVAPAALEHEDLVQQTFAEIVTALRARPRIRNLEAWAAAIAVRTVYQRVRRTRLEARFCVSAEGLVETLEVNEPGPSLNASHRQALHRVVTLLQGLRNQSRVQVFLLHDVQGFELSEIADIFDISVANAQSRLVRGRADVHEALQAEPELRDALRGEAP